MRYRIYKSSVRAWEAMLDAIDSAEKSIYLEMYIFLDDTSKKHNFIGKLKEKARAGVEVVVVADTVGSADMQESSIRELRETGVEFIFFGHWLRRIHRKVLIVDEKIAFIGGVNIGKKFTHWADLMLRMQSKRVRPILRSFAYSYEMAGGKNKHILDYRKETVSKKFKSWVTDHWPVHHIHSFRDEYTKKLLMAQNKIQIMTPYFIPPRWFVALLDGAIKRGVSVEIIIPRRTDYPTVDRINYYYISKVAPLGVKFLLFRGMNHAKTMLVDDEEGLIGSPNIDIFSFHFNAEVGVFFRQKQAVHELAEIIAQWKNNCAPFTYQKHKIKLIDYIIMPGIRLLNSVL